MVGVARVCLLKVNPHAPGHAYRTDTDTARYRRWTDGRTDGWTYLDLLERGVALLEGHGALVEEPLLRLAHVRHRLCCCRWWWLDTEGKIQSEDRSADQSINPPTHPPTDPSIPTHHRHCPSFLPSSPLSRASSERASSLACFSRRSSARSASVASSIFPSCASTLATRFPICCGFWCWDCWGWGIRGA